MCIFKTQNINTENWEDFLKNVSFLKIFQNLRIHMKVLN